MPGLKQNGPGIALSGNKVTPDEFDQIQQYIVFRPTISDTWVGTVTSATANAAFVLDRVKMDYPRNVLFTMLGVAGGMGGTITVVGKDQFGRSVTESIGFASAAGGGTAAGTMIFREVSAGTLTGIDGLGGTAIGTAKLGAAKGTAAGIVNLFGLPCKIRATSDVKAIHWDANGTGTSLNGGTISALIGTARHTFVGTSVVAATDTYIVSVLSTYDSTKDANVA